MMNWQLLINILQIVTLIALAGLFWVMRRDRSWRKEVNKRLDMLELIAAFSPRSASEVVALWNASPKNKHDGDREGSNTPSE